MKKSRITKKKKSSFLQFLSNSLWAVSIIAKVSPAKTILLIVFKIIQNIEPIITSFLFSRIITKVAQFITNGTQFSEAIKELYPLFGMILIVMIILISLSKISWYLTSNLKLFQESYIEEILLRKKIEISVPQYDNSETFDLIRKVDDNSWRLYGFTNEITDYFALIISGITSFIIILQYEPIIILLAIVFIIPTLIKDVTYNKSYRRIYNEMNVNWRKFWEGRWQLSNKNSLLELKIQNTAEKLLTKIFAIRRVIINKYIENNNKFIIKDLLTNGEVFYSAIASILVIRKVLLTAGTIGDVSFYLSQVARVSDFINKTVTNLTDMWDKTMYIQHIRDFLSLKPQIINGTKIIDFKTPPLIELKNVSFRYPSAKTFALKNVDLTIKPTEEIAIVGANGAGKSTLIKLILRMYDVTEGEILINGINIKEIDLASYYTSIGALFQDYNITPFLSIKENIKFAKTSHSNISYVKAAKLADLHENIMKLPLKYSQLSSNSFEKGTELSFGQHQKLVIARTFYRNAPVLILDEPTASIDALAEAKIFEKIYSFTKDKTVIIISHRFSTVRNAQKIYVIDNGKIVESGSHKQLLAKKGMYAEAFNKQAEGYTKKD